MSAAYQRFESAGILESRRRWLDATYFYGYSVEMWLAAAYFRGAGFRPNDPVDRDTRQRRMVQARQTRSANGDSLMNSDPHPIVGWARYLEWHRSAGPLTARDSARLREAVRQAVAIYNYWRPELRHKIVEVSLGAIQAVRRAATWFRDNQDQL